MKENERKKATSELEAWKECQKKADGQKRVQRKEKPLEGKQAEETKALKPRGLPRKAPPTRLPTRGVAPLSFSLPSFLFRNLFAGIGHAPVYRK
jgi:hypothetical protein